MDSNSSYKPRSVLKHAPSVSIVKTTDLIYVFCAAAWVNVVTSIAPRGINFPAFLVLIFTFSMIPLELYTNSLWEAIVLLFEEDRSDSDKQTAVLAAVDIIRIFFLTMSFVYIFCPINFWKNDVSSENYLYNTCTFSIFTGSFLLMNWVWNRTLFKGSSNTISEPYEKLFRAFKDELTRNGSKPTYYSDIFVWISSVFKDVNIIFFQFVFPIIGLLAVLFPIFSLFGAGNFVINAVGWGSLIVYFSQFAFKLFHIVFVSMIYGSVRYSRSTYIINPTQEAV